MELQQQVCSYEQAKSLWDLIPKHQPTLLSWMRWDDMESPALVVAQYYNQDAPDYEPYASMGDIHEDYPAYTVAELGEMLPVNMVTAKQKISGWWACIMMKDGTNEPDYSINIQSGETEAYARAAMLIYLLENNLINN